MNKFSSSVALGLAVIAAGIVIVAMALQSPSHAPANQSADHQAVDAEGPSVAITSTTSVQAALEQAGWQVAQTWSSYEGDLPNATATRRTFATRADTNIEPVVTEYQLLNRDALLEALRKYNTQPVRIGLRDGFIFPIGGLTPSSAFVMVGSSTAVTVEYGMHGFGNFMGWPQDHAPQELVPLIQKLPVE